MANKKINRNTIRLVKILVDIPVLPIGLILIFVNIFLVSIFNIRKIDKPRLLWVGDMANKALTYMSAALKQVGFKSHTFAVKQSPLYANKDFDYMLMPQANNKLYWLPFTWMLGNLKAYWFFAQALYKYDVFHCYFDSGILCRTLLARFELNILKLVGKKIVVMPYGSDAFVYDLIPNPIWRHGLLSSYPIHGDRATLIQKRIRRVTTQADVVIGCLVHFVNLPRWDILPLTCYPLDVNQLQLALPKTQGSIRILHAINHRGVKGTEFLLDAVERLRQEGCNIELDIIEKMTNDEVLKRIANADIYVDQLIFGYALAAIEGMALGKVVVTAIENSPEYNLFRQYSYLNECPAVPATISNIYDVLKNLIQRRDEWPNLGKAGRDFVEKRHSYTACAEMFEAIYQKIWHGDESVDLINFYHPLLEKKRLAQKKLS